MALLLSRSTRARCADFETSCPTLQRVGRSIGTGCDSSHGLACVGSAYVSTCGARLGRRSRIARPERPERASRLSQAHAGNPNGHSDVALLDSFSIAALPAARRTPARKGATLLPEASRARRRHFTANASHDMGTDLPFGLVATGMPAGRRAAGRAAPSSSASRPHRRPCLALRSLQEDTTGKLCVVIDWLWWPPSAGRARRAHLGAHTLPKFRCKIAYARHPNFVAQFSLQTQL